MQAPPALSLTVTRFGVWQALRVVLAATACAAAAAWGWHPAAPVSHALVLPWVVLLLAAVACRPQQAFHLAWDGRDWFVDGRRSRVGVAIDAGAWLLLRARGEDGGRTRWLPVQRAGHESAWHALRCTAHGARPAVAAPPESL